MAQSIDESSNLIHYSQPSDRTDSSENKKNEHRMLGKNQSTKIPKSASSSSSGKMVPLKGKSRRTMLKKQPAKLESFTSSTQSVDYIFYKGVYYQLNDIVSVLDEDGDTYFARINKLIQNRFFDKFALLTWLLPSPNYLPDAPFKASDFFNGPDDKNPHSLEHLVLVSHSTEVKNKFSLPRDGNGVISVT